MDEPESEGRGWEKSETVDRILAVVAVQTEAAEGLLPDRRLPPLVWLARLSDVLGKAGALATGVALDREMGLPDPDDEQGGTDGRTRRLLYCDLLVRLAVEATAASSAFVIPEDPDEHDVAADRRASHELLEGMVEDQAADLSGWVSLERWHLWLVKDLGHAAETLALIDRAIADDDEAIAELRRRGNTAENENPLFGAQGVVGVNCLVLASHAVLACGSLAPEDYEPTIGDPS